MDSAPPPSPGPAISALPGPPDERDRRALVALLRHAFGDVDEDGAHCGPTPVARRWVARDADGTIVGQQAVRVLPTTRRGEPVAPCRALGDLAVLPEYRGAGLARRLVEAAVANLRADAGGPLLTRTEVVAPVFRELGFRPTGATVTTADGRPFDDGWILELPTPGVPRGAAGRPDHGRARDVDGHPVVEGSPYVVATPFF